MNAATIAPMPPRPPLHTLSRRRVGATLLAAGMGSLAPRPRAETPGLPATLATVGQPAPPFTLADLSGKRHDLRATAKAHRVTVLNFWATWCAPCVKELPEFDAVWRELRDRGVALLAVNALESVEKIRGFAQRVPLSFPLLPDPEGDALGAYVGFSAGLPMTFLIDARGIVRQRVAGPLEGEALKQRLLSMLAPRRR